MTKIRPVDEPTLADLIARKRAAGHDQEFEDMLARVWRCPHCRNETTIEHVLVPVGFPSGDMACPRCKAEGIGPVDGLLQ